MGCVSSHLLNQEDDFTPMGGGSALGHHIVSLTSTTYGLLTLDPSSSPTTVPPTPPPPFTPHEVIDSRELMAGLDITPETLFFSPQPSKPSPFRYPLLDKDPKFQEIPNPNRKVSDFRRTLLDKEHEFQENPNPNCKIRDFLHGLEEPSKPASFRYALLDKDHELQENPNPNCKNSDFSHTLVDKDHKFQENPSPDCKIPDFRHALLDKDHEFQENSNPKGKFSSFLHGFEELCPPKGENRVVIYTTTLRGVRKTFEACNSVRVVLEGFGVAFCERDVSMDRSFKEELWGLMKGKEKHELIPPRVFVKGRYVGGCDEVLKIVEEGCLGQLLDGFPKLKAGYVCEVCGGARFIPCVVCNGSCKLVRVLKKEIEGRQLGNAVSVKCMDCNENGLVCCPVCS